MKFDEAENRKKLHEFLDIVLDGNGFGKRSRRETGTLPTLFFRYSGHVAGLDVDLCVNGWESGVSPDKQWYINIDEPISDEVIDSIRTAINDAMQDTTEADLLASDIAKAEKDLKERQENISQMKRNLKKMQRKGKNDHSEI